jgi:hypothetical protein
MSVHSRRWILVGLHSELNAEAPKLLRAVPNQLDTLTQHQSLLRRHAIAVNEPVSVTSTSEAIVLTISTAVFAG